ncbi:hypothetical protein MNBD_BACTEROID05-422 [hydrothermal vent metagenome]|uniref:Uncharacterized protein n=1 Tax=hydrothermal vent metagenome TaxID=652676 RepID=A0A3B0TJ04_9ZZZZ
MYTEIKLVLVKRDVRGVRDFGESHILINDNPYEPKDSQKGLHELIRKMFTELASKQGCHLEHVIAISTLSKELPKTISSLALLSHFYYCDKHGNRVGEELESNVLDSVRVIMGLITWMENEKIHFKENVSACEVKRTCVICGTIQEGWVKRQNNLPPNRLIPGWPAKNCFDPKCLSHKIEKKIDPEYGIPREPTDRKRKEDEVDRMLQAVVRRTKR